MIHKLLAEKAKLVKEIEELKRVIFMQATHLDEITKSPKHLTTKRIAG